MSRRSHNITVEHRSLQVLIHVFGGCFGGREGTLPPLERPPVYVYAIVGALQGVMPSVR